MLLSPPLSAEMRRILALAWPVVLTSLNWTILHVTDVAVVGLVDLATLRSLQADGLARGREIAAAAAVRLAFRAVTKAVRPT